MDKLDRIEIKGFKSIREMDLELRPLNILIGANGAGKTNFILVFKLLNEMIEGRLQSFVAQSDGADKLLYFGRKVSNSIFIKLQFKKNGYQVILRPTTSGKLFFANEICWFIKDWDNQRHIVSLGDGHEETQLIEEAGRNPGKVASYVLKGLRSWKVYHFHDTSNNAKVKQSGDISDNRSLRADAGNLAAFLYFLREKHFEYYDKIVKTVRLVAPFFNDFNLQPESLSPKSIKLEWLEKGSDAYFDAGGLSDGTLRFMCLATLLLQPNLPTTILIDEPELGLHPYAITLLASLLRGAAIDTQVIISTQSVPLVNQFSPEDIIVVDREDNQSVFRRLDEQNIEDWLEDYGLGDLWEKNILGGRPRR